MRDVGASAVSMTNWRIQLVLFRACFVMS